MNVNSVTKACVTCELNSLCRSALSTFSFLRSFVFCVDELLFALAPARMALYPPFVLWLLVDTDLLAVLTPLLLTEFSKDFDSDSVVARLVNDWKGRDGPIKLTVARISTKNEK